MRLCVPLASAAAVNAVSLPNQWAHRDEAAADTWLWAPVLWKTCQLHQTHTLVHTPHVQIWQITFDFNSQHTIAGLVWGTNDSTAIQIKCKACRSEERRRVCSLVAPVLYFFFPWVELPISVSLRLLTQCICCTWRKKKTVYSVVVFFSFY